MARHTPAAAKVVLCLSTLTLGTLPLATCSDGDVQVNPTRTPKTSSTSAAAETVGPQSCHATDLTVYDGPDFNWDLTLADGREKSGVSHNGADYLPALDAIENLIGPELVDEAEAVWQEWIAEHP